MRFHNIGMLRRTKSSLASQRSHLAGEPLEERRMMAGINLDLIHENLGPDLPPERVIGPIVVDSWGLAYDSMRLPGDNFHQRPRQFAVEFSESLRATDPNDPHSATYLRNWQLLRNGIDVSYLIDGVIILSGSTSRPLVMFAEELSPATYRLIASDSIQATDGRPLNGDGDLDAGGDAVWDFQVSPYSVRTRLSNIGVGAIANAANGNYIAAWSERNSGELTDRVLAQRYDANGQPIGSVIVVADGEDTYNYSNVQTSMTADGRFAIGWQAINAHVAFNGEIPSHVEFQRFSAEGMPLGAILGSGLSKSSLSDLAMSDDGSVAVTVTQSFHWSFIRVEDQDPQHGPTAYVTRYDPAGQVIGEPMRLGLGPAGGVDISSDGSFVVAWVDKNQPSRGVVAQTFHADGTPASPVVRLSYRPGTNTAPQVALDPWGNVVITWMNERSGKRIILAQRMDLEGHLLGPEFAVSDPDDQVVYAPTLTMGIDGRFFIGWAIDTDEFSPRRIQAFDPSATPRGPALIVGDSTTTPQSPELLVGRFGDVIATGLHYDVLEWVIAFDLNGDLTGAEYQQTYARDEEPVPIADPESGRVLADRFANFLGVGNTDVEREFNVRIEIENYLPGDKLWSDLLVDRPEVQVISDREIYFTSLDSVDELLRSIRYSTTANRAAGTKVRIKFTGWHPEGVNVEGDTAYTTISIHEPGAAEVAGRHIFYNDSTFDGDDPFASVADDAAIATDKVALLPGQIARFENYTSSTAGINGIMVDLTGVHGLLEAHDFVFRIGNSLDAEYWSYAPAPLSVTVRHNQGASGSDRVEIIWANGALRNLWLEVTVLANGNTGLAEADVFYFGNRVGDTGSDFWNIKPGTQDALAVINRMLRNPASYPTAMVSDPHDINRDGRINSQDLLAIFNEISAQNSTLVAFGQEPWQDVVVTTPTETDIAGSVSRPAALLNAALEFPLQFDDWGLNDERDTAVRQIFPTVLLEEPEDQ